MRSADDRHVLVDVVDDVVDLLRASSPSRRSARGMVWLTIDIVPPPTSFFVFTSARSGSIPVVSQSMARPMVPVGAMTTAWLFRTPWSAASRTTVSHARASRIDQISRNHVVAVDVAGRLAMHLEHAEHCVGLLGEAVERTDAGGGTGTRRHTPTPSSTT